MRRVTPRNGNIAHQSHERERLRGYYALGEALHAAVKGKSGPITVHAIATP
jgi:hypothetical protein